jgi:hypothetical protein
MHPFKPRILAMISSPDHIGRAQHKSARKGERGVTIFIVAVAMVSLLAMAVLAIDIVTLYVASGQAQQAADAAALAGAEAFSSSSFTSAPSIVPQSSVCNGSSGDADMRAQAIAAKFKIGGTAPSSVVTSCNFTEVENPQITVTVARTGLPTFFSRIWGYSGSTVTVTAKAEAYNPSFNPGSSPSPTIEVSGVKPWLVFNCQPPCAAPTFITSPNGAISSLASIGQSKILQLIASGTDPTTVTPKIPFYAIDPPAPVSCPSSSAVSCNQIGTGPPGLFYHDNIACRGTAHFTCGQPPINSPGQIQVDTRVIGTLQARTDFGTECLIHANAAGLAQGQDTFTPTITGPPVTIGGGSNNPNSSLRLASSISRSDSVITVPVFNCPAPPAACNGTVQLPIVGFLQLGIQGVGPIPAIPPNPAVLPGEISVVVLNVAGCNPSSTGNPISGAGTSPVPVRLIR